MKPCNAEDAEASVKFVEKKLGITFYDQQKNAIISFMTGSDIFVALPTGFGKSLIFQAIPLCYDFLRRRNDDTESTSPFAIGIVVSPLVSLCKDQVTSLGKLGVKAVYLGDATDQQWKSVKNGNFSFIYASPEMFLEDKCTSILMGDLFTDRLCGIFVDEVHCVTKWGFSSGKTKAFREQYSRLAELRSLVSSSVRMGVFTATATAEVRATICDNLALTNLTFICHTPNRPNIRYAIIKLSSSDVRKEFAWLLSKLQQDGIQTPRTIVYCQRLSDCSDLYGVFENGMKDRENEVKHMDRLYAMYHSQTDDGIKQHIHESFGQEDGTVRVLFATVAFGMGVDCVGLHSVVHFGAPVDTDDYLQETGRAGRQGEESVAVLLHHPKAFTIRRPSSSMKSYVTGSTCRRMSILNSFTDVGEEQTPLPEHTFTCCDVCDVGNPSWVERSIKEASTSHAVARVVTEVDKATLEERLGQYRACLIAELPSEGLIAGPDVATGFSETFVQRVIQAAETVMTFDDFWHFHPFCSKDQAKAVYDIVQEVVGDCCQVETMHVADVDFSEEFEESDSDSEDEYQGIVLEDSDEEEEEEEV